MKYLRHGAVNVLRRAPSSSTLEIEHAGSLRRRRPQPAHGRFGPERDRLNPEQRHPIWHRNRPTWDEVTLTRNKAFPTQKNSLSIGIGEVVDIIIVIAGVLTSGRIAIEGAELLIDYFNIAIQARSDQDLDRAAAALVQATVKLGVAAILAFFSYKGIKSSSRGSKAVLPPANPGWTRVGRWMSPKEYHAMAKTGRIQKSLTNTTHVAFPASRNAYKAAPRGDVYVEFDIPAHSMAKSSSSPGSLSEWYAIKSPGSIYARLAEKQGSPITMMPEAKNIRIIVEP